MSRLAEYCAECVPIVNKELGYLRSKGKSCPSCSYMVCKMCQCKTMHGKHEFLCSICEKEQ